MEAMRHHPQLGQAMRGRQGTTEMVCDHAACTFHILGSHILIENYNSSRSLLCFFQGHGSDQRKKKGRGTVKGFTVGNQRVKECTSILSVEFSERHGGPIGPNRRTFVNEVVLYTRKWAPLIGVKSWKKIQASVKEKIAEEILV
jgi:hypothetical protein